MNPKSDAPAAQKVVFLVDDEPFLLEMMQELLEMEDYKVVAFGDPGEALRSFQSTAPSPDLLLTDYAMEPINGIELITECRKRVPGLKSILFSGQIRPSDFASSPIQPDLFFKKPFVPKEFLAAVRKLAER